MKKYITAVIIGLAFLSVLSSCKKYLDVVPDDVATLDNAFALRQQAKKFLFTCYSFMPKNGNLGQDPAMVGGDEIWRIKSRQGLFFQIARGEMNIVSPAGGFYWTQLYQGIRDCNIFLANIEKVPDMQEWEKRQWIAEVKFLKAYYHFYLVKMYGPIPLVRKNLPVDAGVDAVQVARDPVDSCFKYIVQLIDDAIPNLPLTVQDPIQEAGRITQVIASSFKAKVLVYAASPLFNGNTDEAQLKNKDGTPLFNTTYSQAKWDSAVVACKQAIDICQAAGLHLYEYGSNYNQFHLTDTISTQLSVRNCIAEGNSGWNSGMIWANTNSYCNVQALALPWLTPLLHPENFLPRGELSPTLKIAEMFYTDHGLPIDADKTWDYAHRYSLRTASDSEALYIHKGYTTAYLNFDRGSRFYADLGFDGGVWFGQGRYDNTKPSDLFYVEAKFGQFCAVQTDRMSNTGYFLKKLVNFENVVGSGTAYSQHPYPWPIMRLAGLYLLYAEALNEAQGPEPKVYKYLDLVRKRAGLPSVEEAWTDYSTDPVKYTTKNGLRDIIHRERLIELAFEGQRFWDLRRWKEATSILNAPIQGWNVRQEAATNYYRPVTIFNQTFSNKDYFWPIRDYYLTVNRELVQNLGW